jgi:hypothetical protein
MGRIDLIGPAHFFLIVRADASADVLPCEDEGDGPGEP